MTNAELIAKIKDEIERRKKSLRAGICNEEVFTRKQRNEMLVASEELDRFNRFLSTLESEKPMNQDEDLNEEINRYLREECSDDDEPGIHEIAEHFAEWQKEQDEKEQADLFTIVALDAAQRAKEQMMREAVEGEVVQDLKGVNRVKSFGNIPEGLHFGDKVRIIIVKD